MTMISNAAKTFRQNSELTFKYNLNNGRHGWLRLTPAYSVKLVNDILDNSDNGISVLDPFSGTGTTPLCAAYRGNNGTGIEINPFLEWLAQVKVDHYDESILKEGPRLVDDIVTCISNGDAPPVARPPIFNIDRWWDNKELSFLCRLKSAIDEIGIGCIQFSNLLLVGFCRILIRLSNAAFNHQSMSFKEKDASQRLLFAYTPDYPDMFREEMSCIFKSAYENPAGESAILLGDSRRISSLLNKKYDLLITSPPYPNRISYIRELRPYMYWLGYLASGREAGELDWSAIGGTWGIATSKLSQWEIPQDSFCPLYLKKTINDIANSENRSGRLLSNYVARYFCDMWIHLREMANIMVEGGEVHYIVGNSVFYNVVLPVEVVFCDMLHEVGFKDIRISKIRKRNSKKELYEYDVCAYR
jgi:hypothetical protein